MAGIGSYQRLIAHALLCVAVSITSVWIAYLLRFDFQIPSERLQGAFLATAVCCAVQVPLLWLLGWSRMGWHGISLPDLRHMIRSIALAGVASSAVILLIPESTVPRSILILQGAVLFAFSVLARVVVRIWRERRLLSAQPLVRKRVLIYGAGFSGQAVCRALAADPALGYVVVGFVDDREELRGEIVMGLPVLCGGPGLCRAVAEHEIAELLIAIPSASPDTLRRIRTHCDQAGRSCKTIPGLGELLGRPERLTEFRQLDMAELLGRQQIQLDQHAIAAKLSGRVVLVTGAAGSIGSELCRQVARFRPEQILALDIAETPLFDLEQQFRELHPQLPFRPVIGDVRDQHNLYRLMKVQGVQIVFHAAAYKHVPLMEAHPARAIENNVLGVYALATAAEHAGVNDVVMISTDKAVRPSSVMGATKRLAEMIVKSRSGCATNFVSVRFGNVLGSNGSVIPVFSRQILKGGPVTVTHPEMRRYFMTIPEASQLVLQATAMGARNEIFVLDMGSPVLIDELAKSLIHLHGLRPGEDIRIEYTGLRPGEKLFEELYLSDENLVRTVHEKILVLRGSALSRDLVDHYVEQCREGLQGSGEDLLALLQRLIPDYRPTAVSDRMPILAASACKPHKGTPLHDGIARSAPTSSRRGTLSAGGGSVDAFETA